MVLDVPAADPVRIRPNVGDEQRAVVDHSLLRVPWIETAQGSEPRLTPPAWYAACLARQDEPQPAPAGTPEFAESRHRDGGPTTRVVPAATVWVAAWRSQPAERERRVPFRIEIPTLIDQLGLATTDPAVLKRAVLRQLGFVRLTERTSDYLDQCLLYVWTI